MPLRVSVCFPASEDLKSWEFGKQTFLRHLSFKKRCGKPRTGEENCGNHHKLARYVQEQVWRGVQWKSCRRVDVKIVEKEGTIDCMGHWKKDLNCASTKGTPRKGDCKCFITRTTHTTSLWWKKRDASDPQRHLTSTPTPTPLLRLGREGFHASQSNSFITSWQEKPIETWDRELLNLLPLCTLCVCGGCWETPPLPNLT
ncbi:hypothetical protein E2320_014499 [Naja naja]|nr:hypothetical protein E2320_014499 [Naja naja]